MKTFEENIAESMEYVDFRIAQLQGLADERGVHITEVEDLMGKRLLDPWMKMKTDLMLAIALHENTKALNKQNERDHKDLLGKYMEHVGICEGVDFIGDHHRVRSEREGLVFTDEEWAILKGKSC